MLSNIMPLNILAFAKIAGSCDGRPGDFLDADDQASIDSEKLHDSQSFDSTVPFDESGELFDQYSLPEIEPADHRIPKDNEAFAEVLEDANGSEVKPGMDADGAMSIDSGEEVKAADLAGDQSIEPEVTLTDEAQDMEKDQAQAQDQEEITDQEQIQDQAQDTITQEDVKNYTDLDAGIPDASEDVQSDLKSDKLIVQEDVIMSLDPGMDIAKEDAIAEDVPTPQDQGREPDFAHTDVAQTDLAQTDRRQRDREPQDVAEVVPDMYLDAAPDLVAAADVPAADLTSDRNQSDWPQADVPQSDLLPRDIFVLPDMSLLPDSTAEIDGHPADAEVVPDMSVDTAPDLATTEDVPASDLISPSDLAGIDWSYEDAISQSDLLDPDVPVCMYDNYPEADFTGFSASNVIGGAGEAYLSLAPIPWTGVYDGSALPETLGWRENGPQPPFTWTIKDAANGILHISTIDTDEIGRFERNTVFSNNAGWVIEAALQNINNLQSGSTDNGLAINIDDDLRHFRLRFLDSKILDYDANPDIFHDMDTKNGFHIYTIIGQGNNYYVKVDGQRAMDGSGQLLAPPENPNNIMFGDYSTLPDSESKWDYVKYSENGIWPVTGTLTSPIYDAWEGYSGSQLSGATISWQQDTLPMGQRIEMQVCGGDQPDLSDARCTDVPLVNSAGALIPDDKLGRYLRWQATFHGLNVDTPVLKSVNLEFTRCHY